MGIVEFLEARLDEDEETARDAAGWDSSGSARDEGSWYRIGVNGVIDSSRLTVVFGDAPAPNDSQADHIIRFDPARALREVAAKRSILWQARDAEGYYRHMQGNGLPVSKAVGHVDALGLTLKYLASAYSEHPAFNEEWRS